MAQRTDDDVVIIEESGHVGRSYRAFDDAVLHTFPGCVFVRAMQTLGRDITHHIWQ
jgi:hypothetical protein